ncbi:restriction system modified-DNA reader domain-containing protein [Amycolatopsis pithecellobii]|uniref:RAMA domain-containing protein n=1 Tax=Amycolatopsis pithecellobii TaxID=664692 RepID=A0A6N7YXK9_9PSEU|nr:hypothetical protein [Amycolatopsis pithecellobii]MTD57827.1 hypothetical protein [Amycolatopsis pithecellobii]
MMPTIRVSDDVFDELQRRATPLVDTPDSVLRKALGLPTGKTAGKTGRLTPLLKSGVLAVEQQLIWRQKRLGQVQVASVTANGCLSLADGRTAASPSAACAMLSGNKSYNGWKEWRRASDDKVLDELR